MEKPHGKTKAAVRKAPCVIAWVELPAEPVPKGVTWCKRRKQWKSQACYLGKRVNLGYFDDAAEAGKAYTAFRDKHKDCRKLSNKIS